MKEYPNIVEGSASPYFPPLYQKPDCARCEKCRDCWSCGKYQRDRRDFTYTSGRCPRLPDMRGFVEKDERELYARTFPLLYAERAEETLHLYLSLPDAKRTKKVTRSKKEEHERYKRAFMENLRRIRADWTPKLLEARKGWSA